jgi:hypothetical protein
MEQFILEEIYDKQKLENLIINGVFRETFDDKYDKRYRHELNDLQQLQWIYNNLTSNSSLKVKYSRHNSVGRFYVSTKASYTLLPRKYRNYLCDDICYDFDMKNAHLSILCYLIEKYNFDGCETIVKLFKNYERFKISIINAFGFKQHEADKKFKDLMVSILYGFDYNNRFETLVKNDKYNITNSTINSNEHIFNLLKIYIKELHHVTELLQNLNIYQIDVLSKTENIKGSWLSYFIQTTEAEIIINLKNYLNNKFPKVCLTYEYDGLKLDKLIVDTIGLNNMCICINQFLQNNNYNLISIVNKSMDEKIFIEPIKVGNDETETDEEYIFDDDEIQFEVKEQIQQQHSAIETINISPSSITTSFSPINLTIDTPIAENNSEIFKIPLDLLYLGSNDIARFVADELSKIMKYSRALEIWIIYNEKSHFWEKIKNPDATLSTFLQKAINNTRQYLVVQQQINLSTGKPSDTNIERDLKTCANLYAHFTDKTRLSEIKNFLTTYINDDTFINRLDENKYELAFQNGILNLKTLEFKNGLSKEDYLTKCIPSNYDKPSNEDVEKVKNELLKICNNNIQHLEYYLSFLGYSLTGDADREQIFGYFRGQSAENGKSIIFEVAEKIMPNYVKKADSRLFDDNFDMKKELPTFYGKRLIWLNELSEKRKDADRLKAFADGTTYTFGRNYATESESLNVLFKVLVVSNYSLNIKADNGVKRRFKLCQFNSKFGDQFTEDNYDNLEFVKDKDFGKKLKNELKMPLIQLLAEYGNKYWIDKKLKQYPIEWEEEATENMGDNNKFDVWFYDNFTFSLDELKEDEKGLFVGKQCITDMLPSDLKNVKLNDELKRMRINFTYDKAKRYKTSRGVYIGFGLKKVNEEDKE